MFLVFQDIGNLPSSIQHVIGLTLVLGFLEFSIIEMGSISILLERGGYDGDIMKTTIAEIVCDPIELFMIRDV